MRIRPRFLLFPFLGVVNPDLLLYVMGFVGDALRFLKIKTSLSSANLAVLRINNFYDNNKVKNELNMSFTPVDDAIEEAIF
jgi:dihydroflavonol-4-reductase